MPTEERQVSVYTCMHAGRQAARHANRQTGKQIYMHTDIFLNRLHQTL